MRDQFRILGLTRVLLNGERLIANLLDLVDPLCGASASVELVVGLDGLVRLHGLGRPLLQIVAEIGNELRGVAPKPDALPEPHQRRRQERVLTDVNRLPVRQSPLQGFGHNSSSGEPSNQLQSRLADPGKAALVIDHQSDDIAEAPCNGRTRVGDPRQETVA